MTFAATKSQSYTIISSLIARSANPSVIEVQHQRAFNGLAKLLLDISTPTVFSRCILRTGKDLFGQTS